jgi:hypothetical protein
MRGRCSELRLADCPHAVRRASYDGRLRQGRCEEAREAPAETLRSFQQGIFDTAGLKAAERLLATELAPPPGASIGRALAQRRPIGEQSVLAPLIRFEDAHGFDQHDTRHVDPHLSR